MKWACFYQIYISYILVETRCWGSQTQWCCSVGHFAMGGSIHSCFVLKSTVATTSFWSCSKKKFANWINVTMMKTNCCHLHHVVSWVWKLLINIKIPIRSLHNQHQELLELCHKINQDKHTHKKAFPHLWLRIQDNLSSTSRFMPWSSLVSWPRISKNILHTTIEMTESHHWNVDSNFTRRWFILKIKQSLELHLEDKATLIVLLL
jgi:hypothetical protein